MKLNEFTIDAAKRKTKLHTPHTLQIFSETMIIQHQSHDIKIIINHENFIHSLTPVSLKLPRCREIITKEIRRAIYKATLKPHYANT